MAYEVGGQACCIIEVCCGGDHQRDALAQQLNEYVSGINRHEAERVAAWLLETYDLAPVGTLRAFKRAIADLARAYPPEPGY